MIHWRLAIELKPRVSGKAYFEVPIRDEQVITVKLDFRVTDKPDKDDIPFLKVVDNESRKESVPKGNKT